MNLPTTLAVATLIIINGVLGLLLLVGKVKLTIVRRPKEPEQFIPFHEVIAPDIPKKTRGRPRKFTSKRKARHLHLPPTITKEQLGEVAEFFQKYKDAEGDRIILHRPTPEGLEQDIEIPYPVRWEQDAKNGLSTILDGWS